MENSGKYHMSARESVASSAKTGEQPISEGLSTALDAVNGLAQEIAETLALTADSLLGALSPDPSQKKEQRPSRVGTMGHLRDQAEDAALTLSDALKNARRLAQI